MIIIMDNNNCLTVFISRYISNFKATWSNFSFHKYFQLRTSQRRTKSKCHQWSILPTFYARFFHMKVLRAVFLYLHFRLVLFWCKNIGVKASLKMLVKLTPDVGSFLSSGEKGCFFTLFSHNLAVS